MHRYEIYSIPTRTVSAAEPIASWLAANVATPMIVGPDSESRQSVDRAADLIDAPRAAFTKTRHGDRDVELAGLELGIADRTPVVVDDVILSGHTMPEAVKLLTGKSCPTPVCVAVHAVFADDALQLLRRAGAKRVWTTDTIDHETNGIPIGGEPCSRDSPVVQA